MCYQVKTDFSDVDVRKIKEFAITKVEKSFQPKLKVFPKQFLPVIVPPSRILDLYRWGLIPSWAKDIKIGDKLANARAETLIEKPSFRDSFIKRRCLVIASGFYEWDKNKHQYFIQLKTNKIFAFAGLWSDWKDEKNNIIKSCTIITCEPNDSIEKIHNRMPAILDSNDYDKWLKEKSLKELKSLLVPYKHEMIIQELPKNNSQKTFISFS